MDIYELIERYGSSDERPRRIVAAIINNLNGRRGIKQGLQSCDDDVIEEIFESLAGLISNTA